MDGLLSSYYLKHARNILFGVLPNTFLTLFKYFNKLTFGDNGLGE